MLRKDPASRVACETFATTGLVVVGGEISTDCYVDIPKLVRETICEVGYDRPEAGFDGNTCAVLTSIDGQSPDISMGVTGSMEVKEGRTKDKEALLGAGDQGMVFGYACDDTVDLMPLPITLANKLAYHTHRDRTHGRKAPVERRVPKCTLFDEWLPGEYQKCEKCLEVTRGGKERLP